MYKITQDLAPKRLSNIFYETPSSRQYNLRGSSTKHCLPQPKTDYLKKSLSYRGAKLWSSLSDDIRNKESLAAFKNQHFIKLFNLFIYFMYLPILPKSLYFYLCVILNILCGNVLSVYCNCLIFLIYVCNVIFKLRPPWKSALAEGVSVVK